MGEWHTHTQKKGTFTEDFKMLSYRSAGAVLSLVLWTLEIMPSGGSYLLGQDSVLNFEVSNKQSEAAGIWQKKKQAIRINPCY